jgi:hypothetical protein
VLELATNHTAMICQPPEMTHWMILQALQQYFMGWIDGQKFVMITSWLRSDNIGWAECIVKTMEGVAG